MIYCSLHWNKNEVAQLAYCLGQPGKQRNLQDLRAKNHNSGNEFFGLETQASDNGGSGTAPGLPLLKVSCCPAGNWDLEVLGHANTQMRQNKAGNELSAHRQHNSRNHGNRRIVITIMDILSGSPQRLVGYIFGSTSPDSHK